MQTDILNVLCDIEKGEKLSFVINKSRANEVIGNSHNTLRKNNFLINNVELIFLSKEVAVVRSNYYSDFNGWQSKDSALMLSCIERIYSKGSLAYENTTEE